MSDVPAERVLQAVAAQRQVIAEQQQRVATFTQYHQTERAKLSAESGQALHDLGAAVLPRLDAPSIAAAAAATGMVNLPAENIPQKLEQRRAWLTAQLTAITRDPRYVNRELLRHPNTGSLMTALNEANEYRRIANGFCESCELHPRFERLWAGGFGTPQEQSSWWRYSYWQDRSAAGELATKMGKPSFTEVRDEYKKTKGTVGVYDGEINRLRGEIAAGEQLDRQYAEFWNEHHELDQRGLEHTRGRIVQHLLGTDASQMQAMLRAASSPFLMLFLRASGLSAKINYLDNIQKNNLQQLQQELATQQQRLDQAETKTRKRWAPMPMDRFMKLNEDRRPRYEKRWQRFGKVYNTVYVYDRYDRGRYYDDLLWWDLMTRGRYDGMYIDDVSRFHQMHPGYAFEPNWKTRAAAYEYDDYSPSDSNDDDSAAAAASIDTDYASDNDSGGGSSGGGGSADDFGPGDLQTTDAS